MKKKVIIALAAGIIAAIMTLTSSGADYHIVVPATTSTVILPAVGQKYAPAWEAETVYAQGALIKTSKQVYMAIVGGTAGSTVPALFGHTTVDGTVTWLKVPKKRTGAFATQQADAQIWYHQGTVATINGGQYAYLRGQQFRTNLKGPISVYSDVEVKLDIWDQ